MQRTRTKRFAIGAVAMSVAIMLLIGLGTAQTPASASTSSDDCERDTIERSITMMLDRFDWEAGHECSIVRAAETENVMTAETKNGEIHVTGDVSPGETVMITLTDGLADADVTVNGEPVAPSDADGEIEVIVPNDGEVTIVVKLEQAEHEIYLAGDETSTEVSSSISSSTSSTSSSESSTSVSTSTSTSTSTSVSKSFDST